MRSQDLKELILLSISTLLLLGLVGFFVYMINTENSKEKMMNMLSSLKTDVEKQKESQVEFELDILKKEKFKKLKLHPTSTPDFKEGNPNPFPAPGEEQ